MSISVKCTDCGKALKAPDALAGKKAKCPDCGATVPIPAAAVDAEEFADAPPAKRPASKSKARAVEDDEDEYGDPSDDSASSGSDDDRQPCPMCGEMIAAGAAKCRYCGEIFDSRAAKHGRRRRAGADDYAGFWMRFAAAFVDGILVNIATWIVQAILFGVLHAAGGGRNNNPGPLEVIVVLVYFAFAIVWPWLYYAKQESSEKQATVGKKMLGIRVTDLDGNRISFGQATGRFFGKIVSGFICGIGYFMAGFTEKKQALHDTMAGTLVVKD